VTIWLFEPLTLQNESGKKNDNLFVPKRHFLGKLDVRGEKMTIFQKLRGGVEEGGVGGGGNDNQVGKSSWNKK